MRKLTPELLDHLPHDDPGAIRSRRDLKRINVFMGNETWIVRSIPASPSRITEIGAGDGGLLSRLSKLHPNSDLSAYDLAPRPTALPDTIEWHQGDIFEKPASGKGGVLIANLILHHFTDAQLIDLSKWLAGFDTLIINEPLRSKLSMLLSKLAHPFLHPITRHDMRVSIEAGFSIGELSRLLRLSENGFHFTETSTATGSLRLIASKDRSI